MRVWSYQSLEAFETLQKDGVLRARRERSDPYFWPSYGVMREMMVEHVGPPPTPETYPLWAWVKCSNGVRPQDRKPRYRDPGHVRLVLEVPEERMLITDFHAWSNMGLHHLPLCERDSEEEQCLYRVIESMKFNDPTRLDIVKPTWQRLHAWSGASSTSTVSNAGGSSGCRPPSGKSVFQMFKGWNCWNMPVKPGQNTAQPFPTRTGCGN